MRIDVVKLPCNSCHCLADNRAMSSCEAVSIALRSSTLRASLGLTMYVSESAGPEGAVVSLREVERMVDSGRLDVAEDKEEREKEDEGADEKDAAQTDTYLQMAPNMPSCLKPNITLVIVEALPRG